MAAKKEYKLPLFPMLKQLSYKNYSYYDTLSEEAIKEFTPLVIMRWLTGGRNQTARQIFYLNEMVNPYVFELKQKVDNHHKKLFFYLMTLCTTGKDDTYKFVPKKGKAVPAMPITNVLVEEVFGYSSKDATEVIPLLTDANIIEIAEQQGMQEGDLKLLKKELKTKRPR